MEGDWMNDWISTGALHAGFSPGIIFAEVTHSLIDCRFSLENSIWKAFFIRHAERTGFMQRV